MIGFTRLESGWDELHRTERQDTSNVRIHPAKDDILQRVKTIVLRRHAQSG